MAVQFHMAPGVRPVQIFSVESVTDTASLSITYGFLETQLGRVILGALYEAKQFRGICFLGLGALSEKKMLLDAMQHQWPHIRPTCCDDTVHDLADNILCFNGCFTGNASHQAPIPVWVHGTPFQLSVWRVLAEIPYGATVSYAQVATQIDRPTAVRAVARAIGSNPVAVLIPCHRVNASSGALTGYRWGLARKRKLLALEADSATTFHIERGRDTAGKE